MRSIFVDLRSIVTIIDDRRFSSRGGRVSPNWHCTYNLVTITKLINQLYKYPLHNGQSMFVQAIDLQAVAAGGGDNEDEKVSYTEVTRYYLGV